MQRVVNNIFVIFVSVSAFLEGGSTALSSAGRSGATGRLSEELAHRADESEQRKGASSAGPPHFRFTNKTNREN